jgi:hypothetical protein
MALWETRESALVALRNELKSEEVILRDLFDAIDECVRRLGKIDSPFARVIALSVIKARNLALGCYSMSLDGLAQEAGALMRPLLEAQERLTYFRLDPQRIEEALDGRLPRAGIIAERIGGKYKEIREHLSKNASHVSLNPSANEHLIDWRDGTFKTAQPFSAQVLKINLHTLFSVFVCVAKEAVMCLSIEQDGANYDLAKRVGTIYDRGFLLTRHILGTGDRSG